MAFDGIVIANLVHDIRQKLEGGKINKIAQPEKDELMFTVKNNKETLRLSVSASASLPLVYFTETNKPSPLTAPNFCMLLRNTSEPGASSKYPSRDLSVSSSLRSSISMSWEI